MTRVKKTRRGWVSSAGQKKLDQRNEKYFPGASAFAWLAQNDGTARCNVASTSEEGVRSIETGEESSQHVRQHLEAHRTAGKMMEERINRTEASVTDTSQAGGSSAARAQESLGADDGRFRFGAFSTRGTNQRTPMAKTLVGVTGLGCFVPGQDDFNEDDCKKSSDQRRHDSEMRPFWLKWIFDSRIGQVPS